MSKCCECLFCNGWDSCLDEYSCALFDYGEVKYTFGFRRDHNCSGFELYKHCCSCKLE